MERGQSREQLRAVRRQPQPHHAVVPGGTGFFPPPLDEPGLLGPVDQLQGALLPWFILLGAACGLPVVSRGLFAIEDVLNDRLAVGAIAGLALAKLVAWWIALGSGTSGGTLAPLLLIGGAFGSLVGPLAAVLNPGLGLRPGAFALVAMAALFGASTRATFTSIVFLFERRQPGWRPVSAASAGTGGAEPR